MKIISNISNVFSSHTKSLRSWKRLIRKSSYSFISLKSQIFSFLQLNVLLQLLTISFHLWKYLLIRDKQLIEVNHQYLIPPLGLFFSLLSRHKNFSTSHSYLSKSRGCALYWFLWATEIFEEKIYSFAVPWMLKDIKLICDSFEFFFFFHLYIHIKLKLLKLPQFFMLTLIKLKIIGIITANSPVVWAKITLPTRGLKSIT